MKILIELPTWIGDTVMTTPAIENFLSQFDNAMVTFIGPNISIDIFRNHPKKDRLISLNKSYLDIYRISRRIGEFNYFISFRSSYRTVFLKKMVKAKNKFQYSKNSYKIGHQVERYNNFIRDVLNIDKSPGNLKIYNTPDPKIKRKSLIGLNPGASYGSAKRWYPKEFAKVATKLSKDFDIVILGSNNEIQISADIEKNLKKAKVKNFSNFAGQTSIPQLIDIISKLDIFVTGDSGPMHIAAAFQIPTVTIFGPTDVLTTCQWKNKFSTNVFKKLDCQPCMKRECPLIHHNCMKMIRAEDVIIEIEKLNESRISK